MNQPVFHYEDVSDAVEEIASAALKWKTGCSRPLDPVVNADIFKQAVATAILKIAPKLVVKNGVDDTAGR